MKYTIRDYRSQLRAADSRAAEHARDLEVLRRCEALTEEEFRQRLRDVREQRELDRAEASKNLDAGEI